MGKTAASAQYARLQSEGVNVFATFKANVDTGAFPVVAHSVTICDSELDAVTVSADAAR